MVKNIQKLSLKALNIAPRFFLTTDLKLSIGGWGFVVSNIVKSFLEVKHGLRSSRKQTRTDSHWCLIWMRSFKYIVTEITVMYLRRRLNSASKYFIFPVAAYVFSLLFYVSTRVFLPLLSAVFKWLQNVIIRQSFEFEWKDRPKKVRADFRIQSCWGFQKGVSWPVTVVPDIHDILIAVFQYGRLYAVYKISRFR